MSDYDVMDEFHDLFMSSAWVRLAPALGEVFCELDADDVIIDLAAGTGLGTMAVVHHTTAEVWALEPAHGMRAVLVHRVAAAPEAAGRVSVVAGRVPDDLDALPTAVSGVVLTHALGHLDAAQRSGLWAWVAHVLTPRGAVVLTCQEAAENESRDGSSLDPVDPVVEEIAIGRHRYRATHTGGGERFRTRYEVLDEADTVLRSHDASGTWRPVSAQQVATEVADHGLTTAPGPVAGVVVVRRAATSGERSTCSDAARRR